MAAENENPGAAQVQLEAMSTTNDYRVCRDNTDPRGWAVVDANGVTIGTASDLIIDLDALTARYIVCSIARGAARDVLIPTGFARLDNERNVVEIDFVTAVDIERLPTYNGLPLSADQAAWMETVLTGVTPTTSQEAKIVRRSDETRNAS